LECGRRPRSDAGEANPNARRLEHAFCRYEVDQAFGDAGFAGYKVAPNVTKHASVAPGVYSYFRDHRCYVDAAVVAPDTAVFVNAFTKKLRAHEGILATIVRTGPPASWRYWLPAVVARWFGLA